MSALGLGAAKPGLRPSPLQRLRPSARLTRAPRAARLQCTAHGEHSHSHEHKHSHEHNQSCCGSHDHSEHSDEPHTHSHGCGHGHGGPDAANPAHRLLQAVFDATRLTQLASWLEHSVAASVGKIVLFLVAAAAAGWAGSGWAPSAAAAAAARGASLAATVGVYLLAGLPAAVDLSYDLTAGRVDTHVLMNLAVLGTLATGHALEVGAPRCPPASQPRPTPRLPSRRAACRLPSCCLCLPARPRCPVPGRSAAALN